MMFTDYGNDHIYYKDGYLFVENIKVDSLREKIITECLPPSPFFLFSKAQLNDNIKHYKTALRNRRWKSVLNYSMKANFNLSLLKILRASGLSITLVSGMELKLALDIGFDPKHLVFNGNGKALWEIEMAVIADVLINIDSLFNLQQTVEVCRILKKRGRVLIRINPRITTVRCN